MALVWAPLLARMQEDFALYAPDRPGCGLTEGFLYDDVDLRQHATDYVCSLLDALEINQADVVAHSAGAYFSFATALEHPERIRKMVFPGAAVGLEGVGTDPIWRSPPAIRNYMLFGAVPGFGKVYEWMMSGMEAETAREMFEDTFNFDVSKLPDHYFDAYTTGSELPGALESDVSFLKSIFGLRGLTGEADLSDDLPDLEVPSLFLWGEHDVIPPDIGQQGVAPLPDVTFEVVDGAGHYPFNDAPNWTAERITKFLRKPPNQEAGTEGTP